MLKSISEILHQASSAWTIGLALLVYGYFLVVIMPEASVDSQSYGGTWGTPDRQLFYTPDELYAQIATWGDAGRESYIAFRLGLDIIWALAYTSFLVTITSVALRSAFQPQDPRRLLNLFPLIPLLADYMENALGVVIASNFPARLDGVAWLAAAFTSLKWLSLAFAHLVMLYALIAAARARLRKASPRNR